jgi:hypothetical protein
MTFSPGGQSGKMGSEWMQGTGGFAQQRRSGFHAVIDQHRQDITTNLERSHVDAAGRISNNTSPISRHHFLNPVTSETN